MFAAEQDPIIPVNTTLAVPAAEIVTILEHVVAPAVHVAVVPLTVRLVTDEPEFAVAVTVTLVPEGMEEQEVTLVPEHVMVPEPVPLVEVVRA